MDMKLGSFEKTIINQALDYTLKIVKKRERGGDAFYEAELIKLIKKVEKCTDIYLLNVSD